MDEICEICKCNIDTKHMLPCSHFFCYLCIRRHLEVRNFCPTCFASPFSLSNLTTFEEIKSFIPRPVKLVKFTEANLRKELKKYRVKTTGSLKILEYRYKELCALIDNERFKAVPRSMDSIVRSLHLREESCKDKNLDLKSIYKQLSEFKNTVIKKRYE